MFIENKNFFIIIFIGILLFCVLNLFREQFISCPIGQIEGSNGKCTCPLVGQVYNKKTQKCNCKIGKKERVVNNRTVCI